MLSPWPHLLISDMQIWLCWICRARSTRLNLYMFRIPVGSNGVAQCLYDRASISQGRICINTGAVKLERLSSNLLGRSSGHCYRPHLHGICMQYRQSTALVSWEAWLAPCLAKSPTLFVARDQWPSIFSGLNNFIHSVDRGYAMMSCVWPGPLPFPECDYTPYTFHSVYNPEFSEYLIIKYTCEMTPCSFNSVLLGGWRILSSPSFYISIHKRRLALDRNIPMPICSIHHGLSIDNLNWCQFKRIQIPKEAKYSRSSWLGQAH